jgi:hypothetical protein
MHAHFFWLATLRGPSSTLCLFEDQRQGQVSCQWLYDPICAYQELCLAQFRGAPNRRKAAKDPQPQYAAASVLVMPRGCMVDASLFDPAFIYFQGAN